MKQQEQIIDLNKEKYNINEKYITLTHQVRRLNYCSYEDHFTEEYCIGCKYCSDIYCSICMVEHECFMKYGTTVYDFKDKGQYDVITEDRLSPEFAGHAENIRWFK